MNLAKPIGVKWSIRYTFILLLSIGLMTTAQPVVALDCRANLTSLVMVFNHSKQYLQRLMALNQPLIPNFVSYEEIDRVLVVKPKLANLARILGDYDPQIVDWLIGRVSGIEHLNDIDLKYIARVLSNPNMKRSIFTSSGKIRVFPAVADLPAGGSYLWLKKYSRVNAVPFALLDATAGHIFIHELAHRIRHQVLNRRRNPELRDELIRLYKESISQAGFTKSDLRKMYGMSKNTLITIKDSEGNPDPIFQHSNKIHLDRFHRIEKSGNRFVIPHQASSYEEYFAFGTQLYFQNHNKLMNLDPELNRFIEKIFSEKANLLN